MCGRVRRTPAQAHLGGPAYAVGLSFSRTSEAPWGSQVPTRSGVWPLASRRSRSDRLAAACRQGSRRIPGRARAAGRVLRWQRAGGDDTWRTVRRQAGRGSWSCDRERCPPMAAPASFRLDTTQPVVPRLACARRRPTTPSTDWRDVGAIPRRRSLCVGDPGVRRSTDGWPGGRAATRSGRRARGPGLAGLDRRRTRGPRASAA